MIGSKSSVDKLIQYNLTVSDYGLDFPENFDFRNTRSLGLQVVNTLVEQLECTIELERGAGIVFKIFLRETTNYLQVYKLLRGEIHEKSKNSGC